MFVSSLTREQQITDMVGGGRRPQEKFLEGWDIFALPFGGGFHQKGRNTIAEYDATSYGAVFGAERQSGQNREWTVGFDGAISEQTVSATGLHNAKGKSTALNLGVQIRYSPGQSGAYLFGQARIGVENAHMIRRIDINGYSATNRASRTGYSAAVVAGGGYQWKISDTLRAGPLASLSYTALSHPGRTELGNSATRLRLSSVHFNSLRSSLGLGGELTLRLESGAALNANLRLSWDRELLDKNLVQNASFADYQGANFYSVNKVLGRDSLGIKAGLQYDAGNNFTVGAGVSSQVRSGYSSVAGNLLLSKRF